MTRVLMLWTDEMKNLLRVLHRDHGELSFDAIATMISDAFPGHPVSRNACIGMSRRMELPMRGRLAPLPRTSRPPRIHKPQPHAVGAAVPIEEPVEEPVARPFGACDIYQLRPITSRPSTCRWPLGPPTTSPPFVYCGEATAGESPYCAHHTMRAFANPPRARARG